MLGFAIAERRVAWYLRRLGNPKREWASLQNHREVIAVIGQASGPKAEIRLQSPKATQLDRSKGGFVREPVLVQS
jgi:hypothetical protein